MKLGIATAIALATALIGSEVCQAWQPEVADIIRRCDSACAATPSVQYNAVFTFIRRDTLRYAGPVWVARLSSDTTLGARTRLVLNGDIVGCDGRAYYTRYDKLHRLWMDTTGNAVRRFTRNMFTELIMRPFRSTGSMRQLMARMLTVEMAGHVQVAGIDCYRLRAVALDDCGDPTDTSFWDIGTRDLLPRHYRQTSEVLGETHCLELTITDLAADVAVRPEVFAPQAPEGYATAYEPVPPPPRSAAEREPERELLADGAVAPEWLLPTGDGSVRSLSDLRGGIVVLDFWYIRCGWCMKAFPALEQLHQKYAARGVSFLGVDPVDKPSEDPHRFLRSRGVTYPTMIGSKHVAAQYHISMFPTLYVIGPEGTVLYSEEGYSEGMEERLSALLDEYLEKKR
ncbi:MAG TPA: TlpA disulfide reductase family protein [Candidatus Kapabacteria bacterium]|nr:TlpA disulfide reductase family protein [Candidatus Kapabacteria bacterium]